MFFSLGILLRKYTSILLTVKGKYRTLFQYAGNTENRFTRLDTILSAFSVKRARDIELIYRWANLPFPSELQSVYV